MTSTGTQRVGSFREKLLQSSSGTMQMLWSIALPVIIAIDCQEKYLNEKLALVARFIIKSSFIFSNYVKYDRNCYGYEACSILFVSGVPQNYVRGGGANTN